MVIPREPSVELLQAWLKEVTNNGTKSADVPVLIEWEKACDFKGLRLIARPTYNCRQPA